MKKEYRKLMDSISLSDKEKSEILAEAESKARKSNSYLKPVMVICIILSFFLGYKLNMPTLNRLSEPNTLTPNPMQRFDDIETASEAIGFAVTAPVLDNIDAIFVINNEIVQIKGQYEGQLITFRMGQGSTDISGDFNKYEQEKKLMMNGTEITAKGNNDLISLALWCSDEFTYSINAEDLSEESIITLIESMTSSLK